MHTCIAIHTALLPLQAHRNVSGNRASADALQTRMQRIWAMRQRSAECLDLRHYLRHNPDLPRDWGGGDALLHLARYGQFEQRPFRYEGHTERSSSSQ